MQRTETPRVGFDTIERVTNVASELHQEALSALIQDVTDPGIAVAIVRSTDFNPALVPAFTTSYVFWTTVELAARNGALTGGFQPVIDEAAKRYTHNKVLARCKSPTSSKASPSTARFAAMKVVYTLLGVVSAVAVLVLGILSFRTPSAQVRKTMTKVEIMVEHMPIFCASTVEASLPGDEIFDRSPGQRSKRILKRPSSEMEPGAYLEIRVLCGGIPKYAAKAALATLTQESQVFPLTPI